MTVNSLGDLIGRLLVTSVFMAALSVFLLPREIERLRHAEYQSVSVTAEQLAVEGLPTNRFISLWAPAADVKNPTEVITPERGSATYVKLSLPEGSDLKHVVVARLDGVLSAQELQLVFAADRVLGFVRRPAPPLIPGMFDEQAELAAWCGPETPAPVVVELLDAPPQRWRSGILWGCVLGLLFVGGLGWGPWFQSRIFRMDHALIVAAGCLAAVGGVAWIAAENKTANWDPFPVAVASLIAVQGLAGLLLACCRGATLAMLTPTGGTLDAQSVMPSEEDSPFQMTDDGFRIRDGAEVFEFRDADVIGTAVLLENCETDAGPLCRRLVRLRLKRGNTSEVLRIDDVVEAGKQDAMHGYLRRITDELTRRYEKELAAGGEIRGGGWGLNRVELTINSDGKSATVPLGSIASCEWILGEFRVWEDGHEQPCLRVPADSENVHVLAALLPKFTGPRSLVAGEHGLGRLLLTVQAKSGVGHKLMGAIQGQPAARSTRLLLLFDDGIVLETEQGTFPCGLAEVVGLARSVDKKTVALSIWIADEETPFRIAANRQDRETVEALRFCEETLADAAAKQALRQLVTAGAIDWIPGLRILLQGVEVRDSAGSLRIVTLPEIHGIQVTEAHFVVEHKKGAEHNVVVSGTEKNALLGLFALKNLRSVYSDTCVGFKLPPKESTPTT